MVIDVEVFHPWKGIVMIRIRLACTTDKGCGSILKRRISILRSLERDVCDEILGAFDLGARLMDWANCVVS